jgi:hypothetical protein
MMRGCRVISYGWGHGHVRVNTEAFIRHRLGDVAASREDLEPALHRALSSPGVPDRSFEELPQAAAPVLALSPEPPER